MMGISLSVEAWRMVLHVHITQLIHSELSPSNFTKLSKLSADFLGHSAMPTLPLTNVHLNDPGGGNRTSQVRGCYFHLPANWQLHDPLIGKTNITWNRISSPCRKWCTSLQEFRNGSYTYHEWQTGCLPHMIQPPPPPQTNMTLVPVSWMHKWEHFTKSSLARLQVCSFSFSVPKII